MKMLLCLATILTAFAAQPSYAAGPINARQINQQRLIDAGFRSGKLTRAEVTMLKNEQYSIRRQEDRMRLRNNGKLNAADKKYLNRRQNIAERNIAREKSDRQRGPNRLKL